MALFATDMAAAVANKLGVGLELVPFKNPGLLADAANKDKWDVGLIGAEPARAAVIAFTAPYCEIEATYLVKPGSALQSLDAIDQPGVKVCVSARSAYDLWLTENLKHASLTRTDEPGLDLSRALFDTGEFDVLAGLRPWLLEQAKTLPGATILDGKFTSVQQAIGAPRERSDGGASMFLERFVEEAKASGMVADLIAKHGQEGKLSVADP